MWGPTALCMAFAFSCARCYAFLWIWEGFDGYDVCRLLGTNQLLHGCFPVAKDGAVFMFLKIARPLANIASHNSVCRVDFTFYN